MSKTLSDITTIVRNVTARTDSSTSDQIIYKYINDFYSIEMNCDIHLFESDSWYEFTTTASTDTYSFDPETTGFSLLSKPAYIDGQELVFSISPGTFYAKWPDTQTYTEGMSTDVLYYDKKLIFRCPPDDAYEIKISAYKINSSIFSGTGTGSEIISEDYWWRYIAYGASLDILSDNGEFEKYSQVMQIFQRYKDMVNARTYSQIKETIAIRNF